MPRKFKDGLSGHDIRRICVATHRGESSVRRVLRGEADGLLAYDVRRAAERLGIAIPDREAPREAA